MDIEILKQFKKEKYNSLTESEKIELITKAIKDIQQEQGMPEIEIKSDSNFFGYSPQTHKIHIDKTQIDEGYTVLTGIIHELRHQWQLEVDDQTQEIGSGSSYILAPQEKDAHEYTIRELMKFQQVINDDEFDIYILSLMSDYIQKRDSSRFMYKSLGYTDIRKVVYESNKYAYKSLVFNAEEEEENQTNQDKEQLFKIDDTIWMLFKQNRNRNNYSFNYLDDSKAKTRIGSFTCILIGNDLYTDFLLFNKRFTTGQFVDLFNETIEVVSSFADSMGLSLNINNIFFPPVSPGINGIAGFKKEEYEGLLKSLKYNGQPYTLGDINSKNVDRDHFTNPNSFSFYSKKRALLGSDYESKYSKEQLSIINAMFDYMSEEYDDEEEDINEIKPTGFKALFQLNHKYSPRKLELLLAAQKKGLNTFYYTSLNEEQIEQLMIIQLEGFKRKDWIPYLKKDADFTQVRKQLESKNPSIKPIDGFELDDDYNIIIKERTLPTDTEGPIPEE